MTDIVDALMRIQREFRLLGMEPPSAILLKTHDQGMQLLSRLHQVMPLVVPLGSGRGGKVVEHPDGSVWMEVEIYGMRVLWPAARLAKHDGGFVWY